MILVLWKLMGLRSDGSSMISCAVRSALMRMMPQPGIP